MVSTIFSFQDSHFECVGGSGGEQWRHECSVCLNGRPPTANDCHLLNVFGFSCEIDTNKIRINKFGKLATIFWKSMQASVPNAGFWHLNIGWLYKTGSRNQPQRMYIHFILGAKTKRFCKRVRLPVSAIMNQALLLHWSRG